MSWTWSLFFHTVCLTGPRNNWMLHNELKVKMRKVQTLETSLESLSFSFSTFILQPSRNTLAECWDCLSSLLTQFCIYSLNSSFLALFVFVEASFVLQLGKRHVDCTVQIAKVLIAPGKQGHNHLSSKQSNTNDNISISCSVILRFNSMFFIMSQNTRKGNGDSMTEERVKQSNKQKTEKKLSKTKRQK